MRRVRRAAGGLAAIAALLALAPAAQASHGPAKRLPGGVERITYTIGPIDVTPGQNRIEFKPITGADKPAVDGWITRLRPNMVWPSGPNKGKAPRSDHVMFHHGVWLNLSRKDATIPGIGGERFFATGEEKTIMELPKGYGYRYRAGDGWVLNDMIHNLTPKPMKLDITYTIDFIPDTAPQAAGIKPVRPIWMDVQNGSIYPVFDVLKGSGHKGVFTYPDDDPTAYPPGVHKNLWTVDQNGVLVAAAGHVHSGGLAADLYLRRPGAGYEGPKCAHRSGAQARRECRRRAPNVVGDRVHLFRSSMKYWEPGGPISWDMSARGTPADWRPAVHKGDTLEVTTDYETRRASWYESMGIMIVYMADPGGGANPYKTRVDYPGQVTHGHLPENNVHGGKPTDLPDARKLPGFTSASDPFVIGGFGYDDASLLPGSGGQVPVVKKGQSLTFQLSSSDRANEIWHSITSCAAPCNRSTGIAYPIPDGKVQFDSGQLGNRGPPTVPRTTWSTPANLPAGTYTFFCRIHFAMRGAFRVIP
ncbi:MAG: hypothetical protein U0R52_08450 [Solirubrobacterales bacterium]